MKPGKQNPLLLAATTVAGFLFSLAAPTANGATETFNTPGTFEWVCPPGVTAIQVECWGGGGAGGAGTKVNNTGTNTIQNGGGGGGGGYARGNLVPVTPGLSYTITIPPAAVSGSLGLTGGAATTVNGGTVTFTGDGSVTVAANGGAGGRNAFVDGANAPAAGAGGAGGVGTSGDVFTSGGSGAAGLTGGGNVSGGGGGGAGDTTNGGNGQGVANGSAAGGSGGIAGGGAGGNGVTGGTVFATRAPGSPGSTPGGGGGGGHNLGQNTHLGGAGGLGQIVLTYQGPEVVKADNADDLNLTTSWVEGVLPGSEERAKWDATVTGANTTLLGSDLTFGGIVIADPAGPVTISPGNTLTLGAELVDIDMSAATQDLAILCDLAMGAPHIWDIAAGRTLTLGGIVSGSGVTIQGSGTAIPQGANTFGGGVTVSAGTLKLGASEVIPDGAGTGNVTINGTLDLNGFDEQLNGFSGSGMVDNTAAATLSTLTVGGNNQAGSFSGTLQNSGTDAVLALTKIGTGALTLGGANSHSGLTTINGGAVTIQDGAALGTTDAGTVVNGTSTGNAANARLDLSGGITVSGEPLTISGAGNFLGALSSGSGANEWAGNVTIGAAGTRLGAAANATLRVSGPVDSALVDTGLVIRTANIIDSTVILSGANTYLGDTWVAVGKLQLDGGDNRLPVATRITMGAGTNLTEFDLNGWNQEIAGLIINAGATAANNSVSNSSGTLSTLTVNTASPASFAGILSGNLALTKSGASTFTLTGANTQTGTTNITGGTLMLSSSGSGVADITVGAGASAGVLVAETDGKFFNLGDLTLGNNSFLTIDYGTTNPSTTVAPLDVDNFTVGTDLGLRVNGSNLAGLVVGQSYPLVMWAGSGPADGSAFTTVLNPRLQGTFSVAGNTLFFNVTANTGGSPIDWNTGDGNWDTTTVNWLDANLDATTFFDTYDAVRFGDAAGVSGNPVITLDTALSPTAVVMNSTTHDYTLSGAGVIEGNASLTLDAGNTRTLTILNANTSTGATAVNGGTLVLGNGGTDGALSGASPLSIGSGATFVVNRSDTVAQGTDFGAAAISGEGGFTQAGSGTTLLNAANTYSGSTVISGGTLQATINAASSVNALGTSAVTIAGGSSLLLDNLKTTNITDSIANIFTGSGLLTVQFAANTTPRNTQIPNVGGFAGTIRISSLGVTGDKWTASGLGTVAAPLIVDSGNTLFVGSGIADFTGGITLSGIGNNEGRGAIRLSNATLGGNITLAGDATINLDNAAAVLSGDISSGSVDPVTLTLGATASAGGTLSGVIGGGTGAISLATAVGGTYTLTGENTYTGGTSLNAGIINVNHSNALGTGTAAVSGGIRYVLGNGVDVPNAFLLGPNAGVAGFGLLQVATGNTATVSGPITITSGASAGGHFATAGTGVLNLTGTITSSVNVSHRNGTTVISGGGTGYTSFANGQGTVRLGADNGIATTATMNIGVSGAATFDLAGFSQTMVGVTKGAQAATIANSSTTSDSTLTTTGTSTFAGIIQDAVGPGTMKVHLTVDGGLLTLSGANSYTGDTRVNDGSLALGADNTLPDASPVSIGTGTLDAAAFTDTLGSLGVTGAGTINLGSGAALAFDDSSAIDWTGGSLTITGTFVSGVSLRFGTTDAGLDDTQLGLISAAGFSSFDLDADGYLIATAGGYNLWAATNAGGQAADLDFDNDGISNGIEYFMNAAAGFTPNPQLDGANTITWPNGGNLPASAYGTEFVVQTSSNLTDWTDVPVGDLTANTDGPGGALTYTLTGAAPRFVRLMVTPQ